MGNRKVVLLQGGFVDKAGLFVYTGGEKVPIDRFLETHTPIQVGGAAAITETAVGFMIAEERDPLPTGEPGE